MTELCGDPAVPAPVMPWAVDGDAVVCRKAAEVFAAQGGATLS